MRIGIQLKWAALLSGSALLATSLWAQSPAPAKEEMQDCPMMQEHAAGVDARGDQAMGFSHTRTTHHFILARDGGTIELRANSGADEASRQQIRMHLQHIAEMFRQGNFAMPMFIHGRTPPGADTMSREKEKIHYDYEATKSGGRLKLTTQDLAVLTAIHSFLRFQIADHRTNDPMN